MVLREIKNAINKISMNLIFKVDKRSQDKRLTPHPAFELFFNQPPGIKQPEVLPTLPLLAYVHNNSPPIKIATMRLRESIFRKGFEWEEKFKCKCANKNCEKEFDKLVDTCDSCGSKNIVTPNKHEIKRAEKFFEQCNIYDDDKKGKRKLLHLLKQIEDDLNIYDDAYIIGIKEYWQDGEGNIRLASLHEVVRANPINMRIVADEEGDKGGRWATCLRHRDVIEDIIGNEDKKCPKCGRKLYEIHYVSVEGGGESPKTYYIGDEVIHVSFYSPTNLYGFSPIVTLWHYALTLTNMIEYVYKSYTEAHLPKGVLAMRTANPDSAYEFWKDVDDKLQKDKHYIPKMFLEGDGNGTGSGMEFVKFMDTLEEMQYIPVRDEIRRTIAAIYGVTNIFIGDTSGVGGLNSEDTQIQITNMAAESGISIYNTYVMPEILRWLNISDWKYVLQSPFEENKQRELTENQTSVGIAQSMLNMGFDVELGEEDVFDFKYSGKAQNPNQMQGFGGGFDQSGREMGGEGNEDYGNFVGEPGSGAKNYVGSPQEAPQGVNVKRSPRGSYYYENKSIEKSPNIMQFSRERRIKELLDSTHEHYNDLLEEYKHTKDVNPNRAVMIQQDIDDVRSMINRLHHEYDEFDKEVEKDEEKQNININIQKYLGEKPDNRLQTKFQTELNKIFEEEIEKVMKNAEKFSGEEIKVFTKKVLDDAIWKMSNYTRRHIEQSYKEGQNYVENLVKTAIDFSKIDKEAIDAILKRNVLWDSYENLSKDTSEKFNEIIKDAYSDPKTFSIQNLVNKMREVADSENYRLSRIARTETHVASMKGREISFQKTDTEGKNLYKWAVRHDKRTTKTCLDIEKQVELEGKGKGVSLQRLNEIIKEISLRDNGANWQYRDFQPHISCRSGITRSFD